MTIYYHSGKIPWLSASFQNHESGRSWGWSPALVGESSSYRDSPSTLKITGHPSSDRPAQAINDELIGPVLSGGAMERENIQCDGSWSGYGAI
jgi:hypothetical protein